jgi:hypothetical protein
MCSAARQALIPKYTANSPTHTPATTTPPPQELDEASSQDIEELQAALDEANEHITQLEQ